MDRVSKAERELVRKMQRQTNADRIRSMTDEELAEFLETVNSCTCSFAMGKSPCDADGCPCWIEWLMEEASE